MEIFFDAIFAYSQGVPAKLSSRCRFNKYGQLVWTAGGNGMGVSWKWSSDGSNCKQLGHGKL